MHMRLIQCCRPSICMSLHIKTVLPGYIDSRSIAKILVSCILRLSILQNAEVCGKPGGSPTGKWHIQLKIQTSKRPSQMFDMSLKHNSKSSI